jgi:predicted O-linked N-acetylglucosamine transferase (SPINDLY family)
MKISSACITLWADVLKAVPESRLLLKDRGFDPERARKRILDGFAAHGVDPSRIEMRGTTKRAEHMDAYNEIDVALDPTPQGGGTTTLEALWMGTPVVCLYGARIVGRVSAALLARLPFGQDMIATDHQDYVEMARSEMARRRKGPSIREALLASIIPDHDLHARSVEGAYRDFWRTYCERKGRDV